MTTPTPPHPQTTSQSPKPKSSPLNTVIAFVAWCACAATSLAQADLGETLQVLTERSINLANATIGVHVKDLESGATLFANNESEPLLPASNLKLITTGAALTTFGPDHAFSTRFEIAGETLVIVGSGDPGLADPALLEASDPPMTVEDLLGSIVNAVRTAGVTELAEIVVDDRVFDRELVHPTWPKDQLNRWYCAEVSGVNFYTNCVTFDVRPGSGPAGIAPRVALLPDADWLEWDNRAETVTKGRTTAWVARPRPANRFSLRGDVHRRAPALIDVALHEPQLFAGRLLADRLARAGIAINGTTDPSQAIQAARLATKDETFDDAQPIAIVRTAMADALRRSNVNSQNMYTEALLKATGHAVTKEPGSWANGGAVTRMILAERLGPEHARSLRVADGSG
ncbi:MAG: D-alanyl-D-alanine carboxypeptidase/D-alanyl-D-alanine-endopeptidase, partial [Planctomycetota bacterium]